MPLVLAALLGSAAAAAVLPPPPPPAPPAPPGSPNVLFIAIDDMRPSIGAMGAPVTTPAMDKLASESLMFDRAFANFPWCNPSRNSLLSGRRPDTNKVWNFNVDLRTTFGRPGGPAGTNTSYVTLPQHFMENGYYTTSAGKIFHSYNRIGAGMPINGDYPFSWSVAPTDHGKNGCDNSSTCRGGGSTTPGEYTGSCTWCNGDTHSGAWPPHNNTNYADTNIATDAIERLQAASAANQSRPWFVAAGFRDPHLPWRYPGKFAAGYPEGSVPYTNHSEISHDLKAPMAWQYPVYFNGNYGNYWQLDNEANMRLSEKEVAIGTRAYYATISFTDSEIGRLLDAARALGQKAWNEMVVVLWSDHGQNVGEHGTWCKMSAWEHSLRVAMMIKPASAYAGSRAPGIDPSSYAGKTYRGPVELLDLYKTTVGLAGLPPPQAGVEGDSLVPVFSAPSVEIKDYAVSQTTRCLVSSQGISGNKFIEPATAAKYYAPCVRTKREEFGFMGYSIRTSEYRYTAWFRWRSTTVATGGPGPDLTGPLGGEELYDHRNDTTHYDVDNFEYENLVEDPNFKVARDQLHGRLVDLVASWQIIDAVLPPPAPAPSPASAPLLADLETLRDMLQHSDQLSALSEAVKTAAMNKLLNKHNGHGHYTLFAPNDAAFAKAKAALHVLGRPDQLKSVISHHLCSHKLLSTDFAMGEQKLDTMHGGMVWVTKTADGNVTVANADRSVVANVIAADNMAINGVAHIIDAVLLPPAPAPPTTTTIGPSGGNGTTTTITGTTTTIVSGNYSNSTSPVEVKSDLDLFIIIGAACGGTVLLVIGVLISRSCKRKASYPTVSVGTTVTTATSNSATMSWQGRYDDDDDLGGDLLGGM